MNPSNIVNTRIERLTEGLSGAVHQSGGAQFALMLSMISESELLSHRLAAGEEQTPETPYLQSRDELYTPEIVARLNQGLNAGQSGEVQLLLSWLDTVPLAGRLKPSVDGAMAADNQLPLPQAALLARRYDLLEEISESRPEAAA